MSVEVEVNGSRGIASHASKARAITIAAARALGLNRSQDQEPATSAPICTGVDHPTGMVCGRERRNDGITSQMGVAPSMKWTFCSGEVVGNQVNRRDSHAMSRHGGGGREIIGQKGSNDGAGILP